MVTRIDWEELQYMTMRFEWDELQYHDKENWNERVHHKQDTKQNTSDDVDARHFDSRGVSQHALSLHA